MSDRGYGDGAKLKLYLRAIGVQQKEVAVKLDQPESSLSRKISRGLDVIDALELGRGIERCVVDRPAQRQG